MLFRSDAVEIDKSAKTQRSGLNAQKSQYHMTTGKGDVRQTTLFTKVSKHCNVDQIDSDVTPTFHTLIIHGSGIRARKIPRKFKIGMRGYVGSRVMVDSESQIWRGL